MSLFLNALHYLVCLFGRIQQDGTLELVKNRLRKVATQIDGLSFRAEEISADLFIDLHLEEFHLDAVGIWWAIIPLECPYELDVLRVRFFNDLIFENHLSVRAHGADSLASVALKAQDIALDLARLYHSPTCLHLFLIKRLLMFLILFVQLKNGFNPDILHLTLA
jgi:hypothetical protein